MSARLDIPDWFSNRVVDGLQFMLAIGFPGAPAAELTKLTHASWAVTLWSQGGRWDEQLDSYRLYQAFVDAAARASRWPSPADIYAAMKRRPERPALPHRYEPLTPERRELLRQTLRRATDHLTSPPIATAHAAPSDPTAPASS